MEDPRPLQSWDNFFSARPVEPFSFFVSIKLGRERERVVKPDKVCVANLGGFLDSGSEAGMTIEGGDDTIIEEIRRGNL